MRGCRGSATSPCDCMRTVLYVLVRVPHSCYACMRYVWFGCLVWVLLSVVALACACGYHGSLFHSSHYRRHAALQRGLWHVLRRRTSFRRYGSRLREVQFLSRHIYRQRHNSRSRQCLHRWLIMRIPRRRRSRQRHSRHCQRLMRTSRRLSRGSTPRRRRSRQRHSRHCQQLMRTSHRLSRGATIWRYSRCAFYLLATSSSATSAMQSL